MAAGDITFFNNAKKAILDGDIDVTTDIKVALVTGYTPDIDAHEYWDDVSANEASGTGYTTGGAALGSSAVTVVGASDLAKWDAADVTWSGLDVGTPSHAIIYYNSGSAETSTLIAYVELGTASNGGDYTIAWNANGIATLA